MKVATPLQCTPRRAAFAATAAACAVLFFVVFADTLRTLFGFWTEGFTWRFLVPLIFAYMLWLGRQEISLSAPAPVCGVLGLALSCAALIVGQTGSIQILRELCLWSALVSLAAAAGGRGFVRRFFWPLAYLLLMTSAVDRALSGAAPVLQVTSAWVAEHALNAAGYTVLREGQFLRLPARTIEVADSCSGVNQLVSMIALGIPLAYIMLRTWWKRLAILTLGFFLALAMNWVRVMLIALWNYRVPRQTVHGPYDIYGLPFIFLAGFFVLALIVTVAAKSEPRQQRPEAQSGIPAAPATKRSRAAAAVSMAMSSTVLAAAAAFVIFRSVLPVPLRDSFATFPPVLAGLSSVPLAREQSLFPDSVGHAELRRQYGDSATGISMQVFVSYFETQNQQMELDDFRYGWLLREARPCPIADSPMGRTTVNCRDLRADAGAYRVYSWFDLSGEVFFSARSMKLRTLQRGLGSRRTNGALIAAALPLSMPDTTTQLLISATLQAVHAYMEAQSE